MTSPLLPPVRTLPPSATTQRIGLFGGSFNPPHTGHLHVAETAMKRLNLDWLYWLPARGNPLKTPPADFFDRVQSVRELIGHNPQMFVSDFEHWAGVTYTVDVISHFTGHCPNARFVWIMGADSLSNFHDWRDWHKVANTLPIGVVSRPKASTSALHSPFANAYSTARLRERNAPLLPDSPAPAWVYLKAPFNRTSSTQLRTSGQKR